MMMMKMTICHLKGFGRLWETSLSIDIYCPSISRVEAGFEQEIIQLAEAGDDERK